MDYSTPFVIGTQSKSDSDGIVEGYVAEFRYYLQVLDQDELTAIQDELLYKYASCDASAASRQRRPRQLHRHAGERIDVPAHVRHRLHTLR